MSPDHAKIRRRPDGARKPGGNVACGILPRRRQAFVAFLTIVALAEKERIGHPSAAKRPPSSSKEGRTPIRPAHGVSQLSGHAGRESARQALAKKLPTHCVGSESDAPCSPAKCKTQKSTAAEKSWHGGMENLCSGQMTIFVENTSCARTRRPDDLPPFRSFSSAGALFSRTVLSGLGRSGAVNTPPTAALVAFSQKQIPGDPTRVTC